jgi:hypothetical protein
MPVIENKKTNYHPNERKKVLATADVAISQVQVVDKHGQIRSVVVWQCGTDILYANTIEGMFDPAQRRVAPDWLLEEIKALPASKRFNSDGTPKDSTVKSYLPEDDKDVPTFVQG